MRVDEFSVAQSTHMMLYLIFASEVGLLTVSSVPTQIEALVENFAHLQRNARDGVRDSFEMSFLHADGTPAGHATVLGMEEAKLFTHFYKSLNIFIDMGGHEYVEANMHQVVHPFIGRMILGNAGIRSAVVAQLIWHCGRYPVAVRRRIESVLPGFGLGELQADISLQSMGAV